jgi:hypothetical protein
MVIIRSNFDDGVGLGIDVEFHFFTVRRLLCIQRRARFEVFTAVRNQVEFFVVTPCDFLR